MSWKGWTTLALYFLSGILGISGAVLFASRFIGPALAAQGVSESGKTQPGAAVPFKEDANSAVSGQVPPPIVPPPFADETVGGLKPLPTPLLPPPQQLPQQQQQQQQQMPPPPPDTVLDAIPQAAPPPVAEKIEVKPKNVIEGMTEEYQFEPGKKRDPFTPYAAPKIITGDTFQLFPLQRFELDQLSLVGIIWDVKSPKAMFNDPSGKGYIVGRRDKIGRKNGFIAEIREGEVLVVEKYNNQGRVTVQTRVVKLIKGE